MLVCFIAFMKCVLELAVPKASMWQQQQWDIAATEVNTKSPLKSLAPVELTFAICWITHFSALSLPPRSSLSTHVLSSFSICDRKTWRVVISESWQHRVGSFLGPLGEGFWEHNGGHCADKNQASPWQEDAGVHTHRLRDTYRIWHSIHVWRGRSTFT